MSVGRDLDDFRPSLLFDRDVRGRGRSLRLRPLCFPLDVDGQAIGSRFIFSNRSSFNVTRRTDICGYLGKQST